MPVSVKEAPCFRLTKRRAAFAYVMRGLDPRIHDEIQRVLKVIMDCRVKPGNDEVGDPASEIAETSPAMAIYSRQ